MMKKLFIGLFIGLLYLPAALAAPASWTVKDPDTTIILFGTFHVAKPNTKWMTDETLEKIQQSDRLYLELAPDQMNEAVMAPIIRTHGLLPANQTLATILPAETRAKLENYLASRGIPLNAMDIMQPWFAATMIALQEYGALGYASEYGGEKLFTDQANKLGIPIFGFETAEDQILALSSGSFDDNVLSLTLTLDDMENVEAIIHDFVEAWVAGDDIKLDKLLHRELSRIPGTEKTLIHDRNENWAVKLDHLMKEPGYFFVAVGAGHLVGTNGVPALMKNAGHSVTRN